MICVPKDEDYLDEGGSSRLEKLGMQRWKARGESSLLENWSRAGGEAEISLERQGGYQTKFHCMFHPL